MTSTKMHPGEARTDAALVRGLLVAQFPAWAALPIEPVASAGTDNALYRLGDDMVVRLPRIGWAAESAADHHWLRQLAPLLPAAIPVPLAAGDPGLGYPWRWSVFRWIDGENPAVDAITDPGALARDLALFIEALHGVDPAGAPPASRGEPLAERDDDTRGAIAASHAMTDTGAVTAAWDAALRAPAWPGPDVWIHGDLGPGNLLVRDGRLVAVIDCAGAGLGDPACDLIVAWNLLPAMTRPAFRDLLGVDDATWARGRGWALSVAIIALPYYTDTNPALAANARHVLREVIDDHRGGG